MDRLEIIRAASREVDLEDSQKSLEGLLDAVAEVADERGFKSPDRQRSFDSLSSLGRTELQEDKQKSPAERSKSPGNP
jgi:hypothetical protein